MHRPVPIRDGESTWNLEKRLTGWASVPLIKTGVEQADQARQEGGLLRERGVQFDIAFTSVLKRVICTLWHCLDQMDCSWPPLANGRRLNEPQCGALQGLNKA